MWGQGRRDLLSGAVSAVSSYSTKDAADEPPHGLLRRCLTIDARSDVVGKQAGVAGMHGFEPCDSSCVADAGKGKGWSFPVPSGAKVVHCECGDTGLTGSREPDEDQRVIHGSEHRAEHLTEQWRCNARREVFQHSTGTSSGERLAECCVVGGGCGE